MNMSQSRGEVLSLVICRTVHIAIRMIYGRSVSPSFAVDVTRKFNANVSVSPRCLVFLLIGQLHIVRILNHAHECSQELS